MDDAEKHGSTSNWPDPSMGTEADAEKALIAATDAWLVLRRPIMSTRKGLREIEHQEREARFRLANAAAHWAYFKRDPRGPVSRGEG